MICSIKGLLRPVIRRRAHSAVPKVLSPSSSSGFVLSVTEGAGSIEGLQVAARGVAYASISFQDEYPA